MKIKAFITFALLFGTLSGIAQYNVPKIKNALKVTLDSILQATKTPGMTFACVLPDNTLIEVYGGYSDQEANELIHAQSRMLAGSIGKTFFAALAFQAVEDKKIALDDKLSKYLGNKKWFNRLPNANTITLRMLMNHTSGIEEYYELGGINDMLVKNPDKVWDHEEQIAAILDRQPLFEAGKGWSYADTNYLLLALALEQVYKKDLFEEIRKLILQPYQLEDTEPALQRSLKNLANGYARTGSGLKVEGKVLIDGKHQINPQMEGAGGGFVSSARNLARWAKVYHSLPYVSSSLREQIFQGVDAATGRGHQYGLGVQLRPTPIGMGYGHGGWFPGYLSEMDYFPERNLAVALQVNTDDFSLTGKPPRVFEVLLAKVVLRNLN